MQSDKIYPIAETFTSVQGEGQWCGTLMHFIRLAGCNVGRYMTEGQLEANEAFRIHPADFKLASAKTHSICESMFGARFLCDTNYHEAYKVSARELLDACKNVDHVCLTGGEPFLHDLFPLVEEAAWRQCHIETSGTRPIAPLFEHKHPTATWITCSPKKGFIVENLNYIDEFKFVVGSPADMDHIVHFCDSNDIDVPVFLQPINQVNQVDRGAIDMVLACIERYPYCRLSAQLHKYLGVR